MAINLASLVQKIVIDGSGASKGLGTAESAVGRFTGATSRAGAGLTVGLTAPIVAFGIQGVKAAGDVDTSLRKVNSLTGLTGDAAEASFGKFRTQVANLSKDLGVAQTQISDGLYQALSAGVPKENVIDFMTVSTKAAIAGVTDTETVVDGLTTVINSFGLEADDAKFVADQMFQTVKDGKTEFADLAKFMYEAAPSAAAAGIKFEELSAGLSTLTSKGVPTSVATTQLAGAINQLVKGSKPLDKIFQKAGYSSGAAALKSIGLQKSLELVRKSTKGNDGALYQLLGTQEAYNAALNLTGPNAADFAGFMANQTKAAGAMDGAFTEINKGAGRQMEQFTTALQNLQIVAGQTLLPLATQAASFATTMLNAFQSLPGPVQGLIGKIVIGVALAGPALIGLSMAVNTVSRATTTLIGGGARMLRFFGIMKNADGARGGLARLGPAIAKLGRGTFKGGKVVFRAVMSGASLLGKGVAKGGSLLYRVAVAGGNVAMATLRGIGGIFMSIGRVAGPALLRGMRLAAVGIRIAAVAFKALSLALLTNPFTYIVLAVVLVAFLIYKYWDQIKAFLIATWNNIVSIATTVWNGLTAFFTALWNGIVLAVQTAWNFIKAIIQTVITIITTIITTYINVWRTIIQTVMTVIQTIISVVWNVIRTVVQVVVAAITAYISFMFNLWSTIISTVLNVIRTIISTVWLGIQVVITTILNVIRTVIATVWLGIQIAITTVMNIIRTIISTVWLGIQIAITTIMNVIRAVISAAWLGIQIVVSTVSNIIRTIITTVWNAIQTAISTAVNLARAAVSLAMTGIRTAIQTVVTIVGTVQGAFRTAWGMVTSIVSGAWKTLSGVFDKIAGGISWITGLLGDLWGKITGANDAAASTMAKAPPGKAVGGPVFPNTTYMVGERGPELFVPSTAGRIIPNRSLRGIGGGSGGGGGSTTNVYLTVNNPAPEPASDTLVRRTAQIRTVGVAG